VSSLLQLGTIMMQLSTKMEPSKQALVTQKLLKCVKPFNKERKFFQEKVKTFKMNSQKQTSNSHLEIYSADPLHEG
jgi:hypothetical protein